jgi:hypothetical protein
MPQNSRDARGLSAGGSSIRALRPAPDQWDEPVERQAATGRAQELRQCLELDGVALSNAAYSGYRRVQTEPTVKAADDVAENIVVLVDRVGVVGCHDAARSQICQTDLGVR